MTGRTEVVGLPEGGPTTLPLVKTHLTITDNTDDDRLESIVSAVNRVVRCWPASEAAVADPVAENWDAAPDVVEGATMLAARLWRRKGSPAGVEAMGSLGATYVMRNDPDIALLLQLGPYAGPQVG